MAGREHTLAPHALAHGPLTGPGQQSEPMPAADSVTQERAVPRGAAAENAAEHIPAAGAVHSGAVQAEIARPEAVRSAVVRNLTLAERRIASARIPTAEKMQEGEDAGEGFDKNAAQLTTTWSSCAQIICCVNSYGNGITVSLHNGPLAENKGAEQGRRALPNQFHLRLRDTRDYQLPEGRYFLYRKEVRASLEHHLSLLNQRGLLASTVVYFGTITDPFMSFHKKFDITTGCLELFSQYRPAKVVVQTRSPMVIAGLPTLKVMGEHAVVAMPVETHLERSVARYAPGMPKISERLVAAQGLRRQGITVNITVSPVLPYGDSYRDAWDFAELLDRHADYVTFGCLADGSETNEKQLRNLPIAQRLEADQQFRWLRPHAYRHLYQALSVIAPQKLLLPVTAPSKPSQLGLFAA